MEKRDFRSLGKETQEALRVRAVFLVLQLHKTQAEAAEAVGVSRQIVNQWMRNYASEVSALTGTDPRLLMEVEPANAHEFVICSASSFCSTPRAARVASMVRRRW